MEKSILKKSRRDEERANMRKHVKTNCKSHAKPALAGARSRYSIQIHVVTIFAYCSSRFQHAVARIIHIRKIVSNAVACRKARVISKRWLALSKYVKSLEIRWLALQVSVGSRWLAEWLAFSKYVNSLEIWWLALEVSVGSRWLAEWLALSKYVKSLEIRFLALQVT